MFSEINLYLEGLLVLLAGTALGYWLIRWKERSLKAAAALERQSVLDSARREAEAISREAKLKANEDALKTREETEQSFSTRRKELADLEGRLGQRESLVNRQLENLVTEEKGLRQQKEACAVQTAEQERRLVELEHLKAERVAQLQQLARLDQTEARTQLLREVEQAALRDAADVTRKIVDGAKAQAEDKARRIISLAIQRYAANHTFETTTSTISLSDPELKGRIIGREGRNIRSFEAVTGVTVLIDDTPNAVVLSGFDPVRREIAREAMQRLILDGRIHPTRIEEVVAKVGQEMDDTIARLGNEAINNLGLPPMHDDIVRLLGKLHFRMSFSQNILDHSVEVAHLTGMMAAELGLDIATAKRAGLLHDIGKAVSHEIEGPHAIVGADIIKRLGESPVVVNAVASHHDEVPHEGPMGILVSAADAISGSRPGARSESMTTYIKRLEDLERISLSFPGVEKAYAVSAGRELRIFVQPEKVNDEEAHALARNIVRRIEDELQYPGQIRLTVVRETRVVEFAK